VIQGFGNVGAIAASLFSEAGASIVGVSDSQGGIYAKEGLDLEAVLRHKREAGTVVGVVDSVTVDNRELLTLECDILIPAALGGQIHRENAPHVRARLVVEAANGPTSPAADCILFDRGIVVLPDILANAGGVAVSYFEWIQNKQNEQWDLEQINARLKRRLERATDAVLEKQREINERVSRGEDEADGPSPDSETSLAPVDVRTAAYVFAVGEVAQVAKERGIWP
jgi:glutamate dehydrogenase (NAD(P)+)